MKGEYCFKGEGKGQKNIKCGREEEGNKGLSFYSDTGTNELTFYMIGKLKCRMLVSINSPFA